MDVNLYYLTRQLKKIDCSSSRFEYTLCIPDIMWLLNNQTNREIRTEKSKILEDGSVEVYPFQLMIKLTGHDNELIEIYFRSCEYKLLGSWLGINIKKGMKFEYEELCDPPYQWVPKNKWQFLAMQFKNKLQLENKVNNNSIILQFQFWFYPTNNTGEMSLCLPDNTEKQFNMENCNPVNDLANLFMDTTLTDVTVKSVEGDEIPAHKIFLMRSLVFKAHFEHNTLESLTKIIASPFETIVVKDILSYIYTGNAPNIDKTSQKLLAAADFYQLNGLKKLCELTLEEKLTDDNAVETLELACLHKGVYLKKKTIEFIKDGLGRDVIKTESWKNMESLEAAKSICECLVDNYFV